MLLEPVLAPLHLAVTDLVFGGNRMKQTAKAKRLIIDFEEDGCCRVNLTMLPGRYEVNNDGSAGAPVPAAYSKAEPVVVTGDETTAVDPTDGFPRYRQLSESSATNLLTGQVEQFAAGQDWKAFLHAKPEPLMLQHRHLGFICARQEITLADMVFAYMTQADAAPSRFA